MALRPEAVTLQPSGMGRGILEHRLSQHYPFPGSSDHPRSNAFLRLSGTITRWFIALIKPTVLSTFLLSWKLFCGDVRAVVRHGKEKTFVSLLLSYQGRRSPRAGCRTTTHRSARCKCSRRCSLGPSTSRAGAPGRAESRRLGQAGSSRYTLSFTLLPPPTLVTSLVPVLMTYVAFHNIVRVIHDIPGQAEVTDLGYPSIRYEHIPGCQVTVDALGRRKHN